MKVASKKLTQADIEPKVSLLPKNEGLIVFALCTLGALRVFLFSAGFPMFNNVDEQYHLDIVYKYAHGHIPQASVEKFDKDFYRIAILYHTPEYYMEPYKAGINKPLWTRPDWAAGSAESEAIINDAWQKIENPYGGSYPTYYTIAGLWCRIGELSGLKGGALMYWIRFLNVPLFAILVWVVYLAAARYYKDNVEMRISLVVLAAFYPQDIFYSASSDSVSPLFFAVSLLMLVEIYHENKSMLYHFLAGVFIAATFLIKTPNFVVLLPAALVTGLKMKKAFAEKNKNDLLKLFILVAISMALIAGWLLRSYIVLGDFDSARGKAAFAGLTTKPPSQWLNHPIFTLKGLSVFLTGLVRTFWRGEFSWYSKPITYSAMDKFYVWSTGIFLLACVAGLFTGGLRQEKEKKFFLGISWGVIVISVLFLAFISILFDYGRCACPSKENPYFMNGRLIGVVLLPFLLIYLEGLGKMLGWLKIKVSPLLVVLIIVAAITCSEILLSIEPFKSQFNWFHLV